MSKVAWNLVIEPEIKTEYAKTELGAYYQDMDVRLATEIAGSRMFKELYNYGSGKVENIPSAILFYICATALGAELVFPKDDSPQMRGRVIKKLSDIDALKVPDDIAGAGCIPQVIDNFNQLKKRSSANGIEPVFDLPAQSPFGTAVLLRGHQIFTDIVTDPESIKDLLEITTETAIRILEFSQEFTGEKPDEIGLDDDYGGLISPEMYGEFNYPYLERVFQAFDVEKRSLHTETLSAGHLKYIRQLGITNYDSWPYGDLTIEKVVEAMGDAFFTWNCETTKDLFEDTPQMIKEKYRNAVGCGAPGMNLCLCARGVKTENIKAFVDVAREVDEELDE